MTQDVRKFQLDGIAFNYIELRTVAMCVGMQRL